MEEKQGKNIAISTSNPNIKDKMYFKIRPNSDKIYWYIKFNILLDDSTINEKTMLVMDLAGYKMRTDIEYSEEHNIISISPIDTYSKNMYYILKISKNVKSKKGKKLKGDINIVFKLVNNEISNYEILKNNKFIPTVKPRPKNYDPENIASKVYGYDADISNNKENDNLPYLQFKINPFIGITGLLLVIIGILTSAQIAVLGAVVSSIGVVHLFLQLTNSEKRAIYTYNIGVKKFRSKKYNEAFVTFKKALDLDPYNEKIKFAKSRAKYYK